MENSSAHAVTYVTVNRHLICNPAALLTAEATMYVAPATEVEPPNILAALIWALVQPHAITERDGELFITFKPGAVKI